MDDKQPAIMEEEAFLVMMIDQHVRQLHVLEKRLAQLRDRRRQEEELDELFDDVKKSEKATREHRVVELDQSPPPPPPKSAVPRSRAETEAVFEDFGAPPRSDARLDRVEELKRQAVEKQKRREAAILEKKRVRSTIPSLERSNNMIGRDGYIEPPAPRPPPPPQPWYGGRGRGNWSQRAAPWTSGGGGGGRFHQKQQLQRRHDDLSYGQHEFRKFSASADDDGGSKRYKRDY